MRGSGQLNLFDEPETEAANDLATAFTEEGLLSLETPETKSRKKCVTNAERLKGLPVEQIFFDVPEEERICREFGTCLKKIGTEFVRKELDIWRLQAKKLCDWSHDIFIPHIYCRGKCKCSHVQHDLYSKD